MESLKEKADEKIDYTDLDEQYIQLSNGHPIQTSSAHGRKRYVRHFKKNGRQT